MVDAISDHDTTLLAELAHHPAWPVLRKLVEERMELLGRTLTSQFLQANNKPDYEKLQYQRGYIAALRQVLDAPEGVARQLDKLREEVTTGA